jgi:hypothetical protein
MRIGSFGVKKTMMAARLFTANQQRCWAECFSRSAALCKLVRNDKKKEQNLRIIFLEAWVPREKERKTSKWNSIRSDDDAVF